MNYSKKVLLTGGSGLIGKETIEPLLSSGYEIFVISRNKNNKNISGVKWVECDLFNHSELDNLITRIKPTHLLNLAWYTTNDYLSSEKNFDYLCAGVNLLKSFKKCGGKRAIFAGTCFEYKFKDSVLKETDELDCDKTTYTYCKNKLREISEYYCKKNNISFGYGRIFYVYGLGENKTRLTGMLIDKLRNNQEIIIKSGDLIKDYMYTKDIANAFVRFLNSEVEGVVNISSGNPIKIRDYVNLFAEKLNKTHLIKFVNESGNQPRIICGDNTKLLSQIGFKSKYSLEDGIDEIIQEELKHV